MARGRMLSKSLSTSERFATVPARLPEMFEFAQVLYCLLVPHADDFGRQQGDLHTIRTLVHPSSKRDRSDVEAALVALHEAELIVRYEVKSKRYIQITQWDAHQVGLHKRTRSKFPAVPGNSGLSREGSSAPASVPAQENGTEGNLTELNRTEEDQHQDQDPAATRRPLRVEFKTLAEVEGQVRTAIHAELDARPDATDGELVNAAKLVAGSCHAVGYKGNDITKLVDAVRGTRARRSA